MILSCFSGQKFQLLIFILLAKYTRKFSSRVKQTNKVSLKSVVGEKIREHIDRCQHLKLKCSGFQAVDNFTVVFDRNTFVIADSDNSDLGGTHWLLYCKRENKITFVDPLGLRLSQNYIQESCIFTHNDHETSSSPTSKTFYFLWTLMHT